jgi:hypothetical protein
MKPGSGSAAQDFSVINEHSTSFLSVGYAEHPRDPENTRFERALAHNQGRGTNLIVEAFWISLQLEVDARKFRTY